MYEQVNKAAEDEAEGQVSQEEGEVVRLYKIENRLFSFRSKHAPVG